MSLLSDKQRLDVLKALVDGNSERGVARQAEVARATVASYALLFGTQAQHLHNSMAFGLATPTIEQDEIWSFVKKKQARCSPEESAAGLGEAYSFVSLAMPSRYVVTWTVGKRTLDTAMAFEADTRARLVVMPEIATDGFHAYPLAIGAAFGPGVDHTAIVKHYTHGGQRDDDHRYEPPREPFISKHVIFGAPNVGAATTAHVERNNGTMRHFIGRMRRLVYAFSKSPEHHAAAVSLAYCYYNLVWVPERAKRTAAMAIGATQHLWELPEFLDALMTAKPCGTPQAQPLTPRKPETTSRELPAGRGFLRLVPKGSGLAAPPPSPVTPPAAPAPAVASVETSADPTGQLDLFAWKPRPARVLPPKGTQLSLFDPPNT